MSATLRNSTLQRPATHCNTLQHTATHRRHASAMGNVSSQRTATHYTATHCNILQHTATHCKTRQHTTHASATRNAVTTHCNTLQKTATPHHRQFNAHAYVVHTIQRILFCIAKKHHPTHSFLRCKKAEIVTYISEKLCFTYRIIV